MKMECSQASCLEEEWKTSCVLILIELVPEAFEFLASDWHLIDFNTLFNDDTWSCLLGNDFQAV